MARIEKFHLGGCNGGDCQCLWELDYRPLGMYGPRRRVRFKTRKQAERFLAETTTQAARGDYVVPAKVPTFSEVAEDWYASKSDRRPSHVADLRSRLDRHILPVFGPCKLDRVTVVALEKLRDGLRAGGYSHRTINSILRIIGAVFRLAIKRGQCSKDPVASVERARPVAKELNEATDCEGGALDTDAVLNPAEIHRLLAAAADGFERTLFLSAYLTGARQGELLALRWTDLKLPKAGPGQMVIRRSLSWAKLKGQETRPRYFTPKTTAGLRTISLPALLVAELKRWQLRCPVSSEGLVFTTDGSALCRDALLRLHFYPALSRARLRRVTFHSLRHSCASALIAGGATITEVQQRLGHANPAITLQVYSHCFKNPESDVSERLAAAILNLPARKPLPARAMPTSWSAAATASAPGL